ncbi:MAG: T9SS type A sorting domain-containing protein [Spirosomaceae bacterium]|nr:T9SS type A sorting domain-containing protein [Spirosomataceae bacterium]MDP5139585.1 T9SS type A sorting domain-containing protein [Spirosomataceae bacterium]
MRKRFLTYGLCLLTLFTASVTTAQVAEKSRLRIGEKPKVATSSNTTLSAYVANPNLPKEINYNKSLAVNVFYRQLLLSNRSAATTTPTAKNVMEGTSDDALYSNNKIHVSNIYPNPANASATLDYDIRDSNAKAEIILYDSFSRKIATYEMNDFDRKLRIDTQSLDNGFYMYQLVLDGKKAATKKLLVRHN